MARALWVRSSGGCLAAGALLAAMLAGAAPARAAAVESAQEITLGALGSPGLDAAGRAVTLSVVFPPPSAPPAASGSFVRIFFSHSPLLDPASSLTVLVNSEPLTTVQLGGSTAAGSVFEVRVPAAILQLDRPNVLDARFDLRPAGAGGTGLYGRLLPQTVMHYQLFVPPGGETPARLEAYPFPLVRGGTPARVGLVLPSAPTDADLAAALRLAADLGRRSAGQGVLPEVVTAGAEGWLRSSGAPALLVGTLGRLAVAEPVLRAAGFTRNGGWQGPVGEQIGRDDGLLVRVASPWDRASPLLLATGWSDRALSRAAGLLVRGAPALPAGQYAIVRQDPPAPAALPPALPLDLGDGAEAREPGIRLVALSVAAPPVDASGLATLRVRISHGLLAPGSVLAVRLGGATVGTVPLEGAAQDMAVRLLVPGSALRPGRNAVTVTFLLAGEGGWARVSPDADLVLPGPPAPVLLAELPGGMFDDPGGVLVVLGGRDSGLLGAAVRAIAELGARTTAAPALDVAVGREARPGSGSLIAVGAASALGGLAAGLPPARATTGVLTVRPLTASSPHSALWIEGGSAELLQDAAGVLGRAALPGSAVAVSATGEVVGVDVAPSPGPSPAPLLSAWVLAAAAAALVVLLLGWQVVRPRQVRA